MVDALRIGLILLAGVSPLLLGIALGLGLVPGLARRQQRLLRRQAALWGLNDAGDSAATCRLARPRPLPLAQPEERYIPGVGLVIGDLSCEFNARSPQLRCTVNPYGPCQGCGSYQPLAIDPKQKQGN